MLYVVIIFLSLSILLYLILGGADFGAGIAELFSRPDSRVRTRSTTYKIIGPIWEANHMWLIIMIVILFVGFPSIYTTISTHLHIPIMLMLLGIIGRGTAFIFRHYDAVEDEMQRVYNAIFMWSSLFTPFFIGLIAGAMLSGLIDTEATSFFEAYVRPWFNWFAMAVGGFTVSLCAFLALTFLTGEVQDENIRRSFRKKSIIFSCVSLIAAMLTFMAARYEQVDFLSNLFTETVPGMAFGIALVSLILFWVLPLADKVLFSRLLVGFQVTMILLGVGAYYYPDLMVLANGETPSLFEAAASTGSIATLGWALILGSFFILPALGYLIYSFQRKSAK